MGILCAVGLHKWKAYCWTEHKIGRTGLLKLRHDECARCRERRFRATHISIEMQEHP